MNENPQPYTGTFKLKNWPQKGRIKIYKPSTFRVLEINSFTLAHSFLGHSLEVEERISFNIKYLKICLRNEWIGIKFDEIFHITEQKKM